jgi:hypothetical protein
MGVTSHNGAPSSQWATWGIERAARSQTSLCRSALSGWSPAMAAIATVQVPLSAGTVRVRIVPSAVPSGPRNSGTDPSRDR